MKKTTLALAGLLLFMGNGLGKAGNFQVLNKSNSPAAASANFLSRSAPEPIQKTAEIIKDPTYDQFKAFIKTHKYVVVELGAPWCPPCRAFRMDAEAILSKDPRSDSLSFAMVDMYSNGRSFNPSTNGKKFFDEYATSDAVPQIFLIINGKVEGRAVMIGAFNTIVDVPAADLPKITPDNLKSYLSNLTSPLEV